MDAYDEIVKFDYTNIEEWKRFVENQILPLYNSISKVIKLREKLDDLLINDFPNLIRNNISIKKILLGGIDNNGNYKPNSLAGIYSEFIGVSINTKEWISLSKQPGIDAAEYIKCNFTDTPFLQVARYVKEITNKLLSLVGIKKDNIKKDEIEDIIENPEKVWDELSSIHKQLVSISANYSYHTFFTINTRCIPRYYLEQAYPKLRNKFEDVAEFLGLEPIFIPDVKEEEIKRNYTLWGHKENGFADLLYKLNNIIWKSLESENLRGKYYNKARKELNRIGYIFPNYIQITSDSNVIHEYRTMGPMLIEHIKILYYGRKPVVTTEKCAVSLLRLIDDLSPALFVLPEPQENWNNDYSYSRYTGGIKIKFENGELEVIGGI